MTNGPAFAPLHHRDRWSIVAPHQRDTPLGRATLFRSLFSALPAEMEVLKLLKQLSSFALVPALTLVRGV